MEIGGLNLRKFPSWDASIKPIEESGVLKLVRENSEEIIIGRSRPRDFYVTRKHERAFTPGLLRPTVEMSTLHVVLQLPDNLGTTGEIECGQFIKHDRIEED